MKKIIFLLVLTLLMSSAMAFAEQPQEVSFDVEKEEYVNTFYSSATNYESKWVRTTRFYEEGSVAPNFIMYSDQHGFTGSLRLYSAVWTELGILAYYEGWVYRGVQPWSLTE